MDSQCIVLISNSYKQNSKTKLHEFRKHLSLWDYQVSGFSVYYKFRCFMVLDSPWIVPCKGNPAIYNPVYWYQILMLSETLTSCFNQANHQQKSCGNESMNFTTEFKSLCSTWKCKFLMPLRATFSDVMSAENSSGSPYSLMISIQLHEGLSWLLRKLPS